MDFKKKCINFKKNAKEFGYDLKLTHVQELLAKYEGFENRHALLKSLKTKPHKKDVFYYDVHVFYGTNDGYSFGFRSKEDMNVNGEADFEAIVDKLEKLSLLEDGDYRNIDYIQEITEEEWKIISGDKDIECFTCKQLYFDWEIMGTEPSRKEVTCQDCYINEVRVNISTDDGQYDYVETFIDLDYLEWCIDNNEDMLELLIEGFYGPDTHTDVILHEISSPTAKRIANYLDIINEGESECVGYSVYVDDKSFKKWVERNRAKLISKNIL